MSDATLPAPMIGPATRAERSASPTVPEGSTETVHVRDRMAEARSLLHLAADRFVPIPGDTVETIIATERALAGGSLPADLEVRFWNAYRYLRANVIAATALRTRYNVGFMVLLFVLMAVQGLFISASSLITAIHNQRDTITDYQISQSVLCQGKATAGTGQRTGGSGTAGDDPDVDADGCPLRPISEPEYRLALSKLRGYDHLLHIYLTFVPAITLAAGDSNPAVSPRDALEIDGAQHFANLGTLVNGTHFVEVFILPALYGALGASVFILRRFSEDLRSGALSEDASLRFGLRVSIGIVAGLAIHWFVRTPDGGAAPGIEETTMTALNNLSRYALSFVGGYGSEIVFNLLDRTVAAFSPTEAAPKAKDKPAPATDRA